MIISILKTLLQILHSQTANSVIHSPHVICHNFLYVKEVATKCTMFFINKLSTCFMLCYTSKQQQGNSSWIELIWSFYMCMRLYHMSEKFPGLGKWSSQFWKLYYKCCIQKLRSLSYTAPTWFVIICCIWKKLPQNAHWFS